MNAVDWVRSPQGKNTVRMFSVMVFNQIPFNVPRIASSRSSAV